MGARQAGRITSRGFRSTYLEADFQRDLIEEAHGLGWAAFHSGDSRRDSVSGFPDLVLRHEATGRVVFAELKKVGGRVSSEQREWLTGLARNPANEVALWFPTDWPEVIAVLRGRRATLRRVQLGLSDLSGGLVLLGMACSGLGFYGGSEGSTGRPGA